jgi:hypothetical protein
MSGSSPSLWALSIAILVPNHSPRAIIIPKPWMGRSMIGMVNWTGSKNGIIKIPKKNIHGFDQFLTVYYLLVAH